MSLLEGCGDISRHTDCIPLLCEVQRWAKEQSHTIVLVGWTIFPPSYSLIHTYIHYLMFFSSLSLYFPLFHLLLQTVTILLMTCCVCQTSTYVYSLNPSLLLYSLSLLFSSVYHLSPSLPFLIFLSTFSYTQSSLPPSLFFPLHRFSPSLPPSLSPSLPPSHRSVLATQEFTEFTRAHSLLVWAASVNTEEGSRVSNVFRENTYPFLVLVGLRRGRMTVCERLEGRVGREEVEGRLVAAISSNQAEMVAERVERSVVYIINFVCQFWKFFDPTYMICQENH